MLGLDPLASQLPQYMQVEYVGKEHGPWCDGRQDSADSVRRKDGQHQPGNEERRCGRQGKADPDEAVEDAQARIIRNGSTSRRVDILRHLFKRVVEPFIPQVHAVEQGHVRNLLAHWDMVSHVCRIGATCDSPILRVH